jgi:signal transduction histidine kinase
MDSNKVKALEDSYQRIINVGFCMVPYEDLSDIIVDEPIVFGTTKDERIFTFEGVKQLFESQFEQMQGMKPSLESNRIATHISPDGNSAFISEENTLTLESPDEVNSIFLRISCVMDYIDNGWKLTHWHASTPVDTENDHWHMEEWKREKEKLQQLVDQQTADLQLKNRELEIEAAIERVRAVAMGMTQPDDMLDVCRVISDQLQQFGVDRIRNVQTAIIDEEIGRYLCYQYFTPYDETTIESTEYHKSPVEHEMVKKMLASRNEQFIGTLAGEDLDTFRTHRKDENQFPDPLLDEASSLDYCFLSIGEGGLGLSLYEPFSQDVLTLFSRFHQVFSLAYRRFRDIEKAQSQAREAQIELSLERIRAEVTAMRESSDLLDIVVVMRSEFVKLGYEAHYFWHMRWLPDRYDKAMTSGDGSRIGMVMTLPCHIHGDIEPVAEWEKGKEPTYVLAMDVQEAVDYVDKMISLGDFEQVDPHAPTLDDIRHIGGLTFIMARTTHGEIGYSLPGVVPNPPKEAVDTLVRFAGVFDLAYQRFEDLKKAEAQARETQIELALERVRARTMAMQKSEELADVAFVLFEQLRELGADLWGTGFGLCENDSDKDSFWFANENGVFPPVAIPNTADPAHKQMYEGWKAGKDYMALEASGKELKSHYDYMLSLPEVKPFFQKILDEGLPLPEWQQWNAAYFKHGYLLIISLEPYPDPDILVRFAGVFDQTYTRFLDLKRAESQARESQIEAALERVRSRSLAMHKTDELQDVVRVVAEELKNTGVILDTGGAVICTYFQDSKDVIHWTATDDPAHPSIPYMVPYFEDELFDEAWASKNRGDDYFAKEFSFDVKNAFFNHAFEHSDYRQLPEEYKKIILESKSHGLAWAWSENSAIMIPSLHGDLPSEEEKKILVRFAKVFEQSFIRFLDLKKSEEQAKEAKIQLALERVRAKTMAMKTQSDLLDIIELFGQQLNAVDIKFGNVTFIEGAVTKTRDWDLWSHAPDAEIPTQKILIPYIEDPHFKRTAEAVEQFERTGQTVHVKSFTKSEKDSFVPHFVKHIPEHVTEDFIEILYDAPGEIIVDAFFEEITVSLVKWDDEPYTEDELAIFERFAKEFRQTYIRYLDIKKAEEQAREAQIEAALERVRSRSMGMQSSNDLSNVASVMFDQMKHLGGELFSFGIVLCDKEKDTVEQWHSLGNEGMVEPFTVPVNLDYIHQYRYDQWKAGEELFSVEIPEDYIKEHFELMFELPSVKSAMDEVASQGVDVEIPDWEIDYGASFRHGYLLVSSRKPFEESHIFPRFARVFDQAYTRFLDLKKAEEQAREAKVEAALEKVRSRSMGMQSSDELPEVANLLFKEIQGLGIPAWSCGYNILNDDKRTATAWMSSEGTLQEPFTLRLFGEASFDEMREFILSDETMLVQELGGKELESHYARMKSFPDLQPTFEKIEAQGLSLPAYQINHLCRFSHGFLMFITYEPVTDAHDIFKRFTKVFDQTYTRFLDLQKAEAQAREAQIANALEKVRSRSLAMQKPDELVEVAQLLREEMGALGVEELETSSIYIHDDSSGLTQCWFTIKDRENPDKSVADKMVIDLQDTWVGREMDAFYRSDREKTSILMKGDHRIEWIRYAEEKSDLFGNSEFYGDTIPERTYHLYKFSNGFLGAASPGDISDESWDLMRRATNVFSFAYTRFRDLQKAEESARQSRQQASLDRVRADISSMRSADDLNRITPLIWNELTTLGIPFIRCGVFIIHENEQLVEVYLSKPDGTSLAVMHLPFDANDLTVNAVKGWREKHVYRQHWTKEEFLKWSRSMMEIGQIENLESYQGAEEAPESLNLHFIPFNQGMLYVGSTEQLDDEEIGLSESLAKAFSIAYARYEDFVKLEKAKASIEDTLSELKATQSQLVQQEKLASLGQLTAGIAHEIKNPLNFVNNFSDLSVELIEEAKEEVLSERAKVKRQKSPFEGGKDGEAVQGDDPGDDYDFLMEILSDIEINLKKIHEHGTRADSIVKSMLQHSRGGDGTIEPTPLNPIIKEYVNLAFHGMRAGKNPINVDIDLQLDENIGEVPLIAEDFSRVILNLLNNAFDAMGEKSLNKDLQGFQTLGGLDSYQPKLSIRTRQKQNTVTIEIEDNGPGIPDDIKDKILQPFFTTKKGTAGTGLGLSITNDIVKAHGGSLAVESKPGETVFTIVLNG